MHRSFRFLKVRLTKEDRNHIRNIQDKRTGKALFLRFYATTQPSRKFAPSGPAACAQQTVANIENRS